MTEFTRSVRGAFCWVELATGDPESALRFYGELFGWSAKRLPSRRGGAYLMLQRGGKNVGGIVPAGDKLATAKGAPPHWLSYVAVADLVASMLLATEHGGRVVAGPSDAGGGRVAVVRDPTGAVLALWQDRHPKMAPWLQGEPGASCWYELTTGDVDAATAFYGHLFSWKPLTTTVGGHRYVAFQHEGVNVAGMMSSSSHVEHAAVGWTPYFGVDDCEESLMRAQRLGARLLRGPVEVRSTGRFATFQDPQGADFAILQQRPMTS